MPGTLSTLDERLSRLEENSFFQETAIEALNDALTRQQFQIDALEKRLAVSEERLRALQELLDDGGEATVPPHSVPERY
ncbi:MAG: SlyX family protein [Desulfovibrionaceae bacterium]|nr:SlyX family protein [Desulfovibrionaceae bacterium]